MVDARAETSSRVCKLAVGRGGSVLCGLAKPVLAGGRCAMRLAARTFAMLRLERRSVPKRGITVVGPGLYDRIHHAAINA